LSNICVRSRRPYVNCRTAIYENRKRLYILYQHTIKTSLFELDQVKNIKTIHKNWQSKGKFISPKISLFLMCRLGNKWLYTGPIWNRHSHYLLGLNWIFNLLHGSKQTSCTRLFCYALCCAHNALNKREIIFIVYQWTASTVTNIIIDKFACQIVNLETQQIPIWEGLSKW